ncbi:MAG: hypothetical protein AABZ63_07200 [Actinomycetota bacterium]
MNLKTITRGGIIAAMYVVLTVTPGLNALGVAFIISMASSAEDNVLFWPTAFTVGLGELGVMVVLAAPLFVMLKKNPAIIGLEQRL